VSEEQDTVWPAPFPAHAFWPRPACGRNASASGKRFGNAVLSNFPITFPANGERGAFQQGLSGRCKGGGPREAFRVCLRGPACDRPLFGTCRPWLQRAENAPLVAAPQCAARRVVQ
jgi:hypothetical protein